ncbi:hypothetical protein ACQUJS_10690 [Ralstonia pseudosolanacearum]|uniref:Transmembrane protein n=1 Tax=Ralstonia solanacearum TaxID=305 RepID=A0A0S4TMT8_RALSL|nr:conserved membrane protein of unknown function [Ralstonia solanacearum]
MHYTLAPRTNAALIVLEAALALGCYLAAGTSSLPMWGGFASAGVCAGFLQSAALRRNVRALKVATSASQVRAALSTSIPGKAAIALLWAAGMAVAAMFLYGSKYATIPTLLGFYAIFSLGREVTAFPALLALRDA